MTRKKFLRRLYRALLLRLTPAEARDVTADYEGFFADRLGEGKTEEEVCREFGNPREVVRDIIREDGKKTKPFGVLGLVWSLAGLWWANFGWLPFTSMRYWLSWRENPQLLGGTIFLCIPLLWVLWHKSVYPALKPKRREFAAVCVIPVLLWGLFWGFCLYAMGKPLESWTFTKLVTSIGDTYMVSKVGQFVRTLSGLFELAIVVVFLLCVLWAWSKTPWYLVSAAHALGSFGAMGVIISQMHDMSLDHSIEEAASAMLYYPLTGYLLMGLGGAVLTALLVWIGGRHGRSA